MMHFAVCHTKCNLTELCENSFSSYQPIWPRLHAGRPTREWPLHYAGGWQGRGGGVRIEGSPAVCDMWVLLNAISWRGAAAWRATGRASLESGMDWPELGDYYHVSCPSLPPPPPLACCCCSACAAFVHAPTKHIPFFFISCLLLPFWPCFFSSSSSNILPRPPPGRLPPFS